ncbi:hypothetical protein EW093_15975 [Thiospirochaeta perfilievii]|uniref:SSD domain-containing protein n=1 Tax=Thiospirochaeta perfilievii TaxID=252967 RepID=A0A5C1QG55_9SPIO|nr:hypothetical protein [Thiospirochaeta perfilievii]QEN06120.1 hypothetical protein EW093_15975 [Thiospirochaeta perfilievii]
MKKVIYPIIMVSLIVLFYTITPIKSQGLSVYIDGDNQLLIPQKNIVITTVNLIENNLNLKKISTIKQLQDLNDQLKNIPGVNSVDSLLNATTISSSNDDIEISQFIKQDINESQLEGKINSINQYPELKLYVDSNKTSLLFYINFGYSVIPSEILKDLEDINRSSDIKFNFTGKSPIISITEKLLSNDILIFTPILFILIMIIFLSFRSRKAILLSWVIILLSITLSYTLIRFSGISITPLILLVPVFSLGLLSDYVIHYIYHLFYEKGELTSFKIRKNLLYPLGLTALSTITGFLSLIYINASGHIILGGIVALSVLFTFIGVLFWLPYLYLKLPKKPILIRYSTYQVRLFKLLYKNKKILLILLIIGIFWGLIKLPSLRTEPYPIEQLPKSSTIRKAEGIINSNFYGSLPFFLEIDSGEANKFLEKDSLKILEKLHKTLNNSDEVGYSYSLLTILKRINFYFWGNEESLLNGTEFDDNYPFLIEQYLLYYTTGVDPLEFESLVDPSYRFFSIKGFIRYSNVESLNNFYNTIDGIRESLPKGWSISVNGTIKDLNREKNGLTKNWIFSFLLGSFLIFITVLLFYKKLSLALLSLLPGFLSMILSFGIITTLGVTIDSFSIIFVAIITGLVIDYSIHTLSAIDKLPPIKDIGEGFSYINNYSGIPLFLSFLTSLSSFSVLFLSSFSGARNLGILLFTSLIFSYILSFYLLPILILPTKIQLEV